MADNDNQQAPSVNDGASSGQDLAADLKKLAHAVYENRDDEAKWQEFLQQTTDDVIALVSADPSVLSDVLSAENEAAVDTIIDEILAKHNATNNQVAESESVSQDSESEKAAESPVQTERQHERDGEGNHADEIQSESKQVAASTTAQSTESPENTESQNQDNSTAQASVDDEDDGRCSDKDFADFLASIYAVKDRDDGVDKLLQKAESNIMERLYSNPFYLTRVMEMTNDNELKDLLELVRRPSGPFYADDQPQMAAVTDENIDYVLDNYAYINFDCVVSDPENPKLNELIKSMPEPSWFSSTGVPVSCQLSDDKKIMTVAVSLRGTLEGFDPAIAIEGSEGDVNVTAPGVLDSSASKRMIVAGELLEMIHAMGLEQVKIRAGRRVMMRNLWALLTVNDIQLTGFEPSPSEQTWLDKRAHFLTDQFGFQNQAAPTMAPGLGRGSSGTSTVSDDADDSIDAPESNKPTVSESGDQIDHEAQASGVSAEKGPDEDTATSVVEGADDTAAATDGEQSEKTSKADEAKPDTIDAKKPVDEASSIETPAPSMTEDQTTPPKKKPVTKKAAVATTTKKATKKSDNATKKSTKAASKTSKKDVQQDES